MGYFSVYVLLLLVNKEAVLAYGRAEYSQAGRVVDVKESRQSQQDTGGHARTIPVDHGLMAIHRLIEMG